MRHPVKRSAGLRPLMIGLSLAAAAGLADLSPTSAHIELVPTMVNRYLTLAVRGERLHLQLSLLYGDIPALEERRRMDGDGDGRLAAGEVNHARRAFARQARELLALRLDDRPVKLAPTVTIVTSDRDTVSPTPLQLDLTAVLELPPGTRRLELMLGPDLPRMGETEIVLELDRGWRLEGSENPTGRLTAGPQARFNFPAGRAASAGGRTVAFHLAQQPGGGPGRRPGRLLALGGVLAALVLAAIALAARLLRSARRAGEEPRGDRGC